MGARRLPPADRGRADGRSRAREEVAVAFLGRAGSAAGEPWEGKNALDAVVLLFQAIGLWRQQLPQHARVHGIILEGGSAANIIPDRATARFMIRSPDQAYFASLRQRLRALVAAPPMRARRAGRRVPGGGGGADGGLPGDGVGGVAIGGECRPGSCGGRSSGRLHAV
mgnify:CR=1 FL=1